MIARSRSTPLMVSAAAPDGAIGRRETRGGAVSRARGDPDAGAHDRGGHERGGHERDDAPPQRPAWRRRGAIHRDSRARRARRAPRRCRQPACGDPSRDSVGSAHESIRARVAGSAVQSGSLLQHGAEHVGDVLAVERPRPRQHLVQHAAEGPDVAALVRRPRPSPAPAPCRPPCRGSRPRRSSSRAT